MGKINISQAKRPTRTQQEGMMTSSGSEFRRRMPASAQRHTFLRREVLWPAREAVVNSNRTEIQDIDGKTEEIKQLVLEMGAEAVGVAEYDPRFLFTDVSERAHQCGPGGFAAGGHHLRATDRGAGGQARSGHRPL